MKTVGLYEARTQFGALVREASAGEVIVISDRGRPVAKLGPIEDDRKARAKAAADWFRERAKHNKLDGLSILDLVHEGRRE